MPQPVDLPSELARTSAAERMQQLADRASLAGQQRLAQQAQAESIRAESQVRESPESKEKSAVDDGGEKTTEQGKSERGTGDGDRSDDARILPNPGEFEVIPDERNHHQLDVTV